MTINKVPETLNESFVKQKIRKIVFASFRTFHIVWAKRNSFCHVWREGEGKGLHIVKLDRARKFSMVLKQSL